MKSVVFVLLAVLVASAFAQSTVSNEVLFVDSKGNVNRPETLATMAQMAANEAALLTAEQKAEAAAAAAEEGTNLVKDVVRDITANELVIYRYGYTDAFGVVVMIDPDAELRIAEFKPLDTKDGAGRQGFYMEYALKNSTSVLEKPAVKYGTTLTGGTASFPALPEGQVEDPSYIATETDENGKVWYRYSLTFYAEQSQTGFFIINLSADDAAGDGWTLDLPNGVKGGRTVTYMFGSQTLEFVGGLCME